MPYYHSYLAPEIVTTYSFSRTAVVCKICSDCVFESMLKLRFHHMQRNELRAAGALARCFLEV